MPKAITKYAEVSLQKNTDKGGAWLCHFAVKQQNGDMDIIHIQAFSNASAGKRWAKENAVNLTGRKSIKWVINEADVNNKPIYLTAKYEFKVKNV